MKIETIVIQKERTIFFDSFLSEIDALQFIKDKLIRIGIDLEKKLGFSVEDYAGHQHQVTQLFHTLKLLKEEMGVSIHWQTKTHGS